MAGRTPFRYSSNWTFEQFLERLFAHYIGYGIQSTGYRLNAIRGWLSMVGRTRALAELERFEDQAPTRDEAEIAKSLGMSKVSYRRLKQFVRSLEDDRPRETRPALTVFVSYKWDSGEHVAWVRRLAADLRAHGIDAVLDQWMVRLGRSLRISPVAMIRTRS